MPKAVVLLSGGLDSATCLAIAKSHGFECCCLSFQYGQRHAIEIERAKELALTVGVKEHKFIEIDLQAFGGSALTDDIAVPKDGLTEEIPVTYVPARNTVFLSYALAYAEVVGAQDIFIGVNALDYSGYPDCRAEFIEAFEQMANLATKAAVEGRVITIRTPLIDKTKAQIIAEGLKLGVDFAMTTSCYDPAPDGSPCGLCDSCRIRSKGFAELGTTDPLLS